MAKEHVIDRIEPGSIAEELELEKGDVLLSINGQKIEDVFDYHYLVNDEELTVVVRKKDGEEWELEIEKDYMEDLGIEFENGLMITVPARINVCSALSIRCQKECEKRYILKMMIPDCLFCREIM